jgi:hypothetical protein
MLPFDENGIGRFSAAIRRTRSVPDRPATCEPTEHPVHAEFPGWNSACKIEMLNSHRGTATRKMFLKVGACRLCQECPKIDGRGLPRYNRT